MNRQPNTPPDAGTPSDQMNAPHPTTDEAIIIDEESTDM